MFNEDNIEWMIRNPDLLVTFLRKEAKVAKSVYGKRTPARRGWKRARRSAIRLLNAINELDDHNESMEIDIDEGFEIEPTPRWRTSELDFEISEAQSNARETLRDAIATDFEESKKLPWATRTSLSLSRRVRLTRLFLLNEPSPWERARERARGIFF